MATPTRKIRLDDRTWTALENYASALGLLDPKTGRGDRTAALRQMMAAEFDRLDCWPPEEVAEGQLSFGDLGL